MCSYRTAASLHARLQDSLGQAATRNAPRPIFGLGELVQHSRHDYCGTVIGWRAGCPEDAQWRDAAGYGSIPSAESEIWYFLLVNAVSGEPKESGLVPVALVPERCLGRAAHSGEFSRSGASAQSAAVLEALFLGYDDEGQLVACQQLKDRFARPIDQIPSAGRITDGVTMMGGILTGIAPLTHSCVSITPIMPNILSTSPPVQWLGRCLSAMDCGRASMKRTFQTSRRCFWDSYPLAVTVPSESFSTERTTSRGLTCLLSLRMELTKHGQAMYTILIPN